MWVAYYLLLIAYCVRLDEREMEVGINRSSVGFFEGGLGGVEVVVEALYVGLD